MGKTPSTELHAVKQEPEPANGDGTPLEQRKTDPEAEPPWVAELRRMLEEQGERIATIEKRLGNLDGSLTVLGNAYKVQAQELQLLRQACPACDADEPITAS